MIDLNRLRQEPEVVKALILKKEPKFNMQGLIDVDVQFRLAKTELEALLKERNLLAKQGAAGITSEVRQKSIDLSKAIKSKEVELIEIENHFNLLALACPNIPQEDIQAGGKEENLAVKTVGQKPEFNFAIKNHMQLNEKLGWFDFEVAAQMTGTQFVFYKKEAVKLMYALTRMMLQNNVKHGFEPVIPPFLVNRQALVNASNLPKFEGDYYTVAGEDLNLIPTSEVSLTNLYADKILSAANLPIRHTAWTSCFRREAGGYGALERGLIRIHQFEKVELYSICKPEDSNQELERMVLAAEDILNQLGLHYKVMLLAAEDCSFASARTYDIEVWLPGQDRYYEVSSCSNCTSFQARRSGIRYRESADDKPQYAHTLNASSLALPRLMVALMETYQQEDGTIKFPPVLVKMMQEVW